MGEEFLPITHSQDSHFKTKDVEVTQSLRPDGLHSPWNSPGQNTGVGSLSLVQWIFPTQESNWGLQHCRQILYQLSYQGSKTKGKDGLNISKLQKVKRADNETSAKIELLCTLHRSSLRKKMIIIILDSSQGCCLLHIRQQMRRPLWEIQSAMTQRITIPDTFMFILPSLLQCSQAN